MSDYVLLSLLNELGKRDKIHGLIILTIFDSMENPAKGTN